MYSTHNEFKSVVVERFIKTLKGKTYKKLSAHNKKYYLGYLNKLVDKYNAPIIYHSFSKKPADADYSSVTEEKEAKPKSPKIKVGNRVRITKNKDISIKGYTKNWSKEIFVLDFVLKTNLWTYKIKDLNKKKIIGSFYEKEFLLSKL